MWLFAALSEAKGRHDLHKMFIQFVVAKQIRLALVDNKLTVKDIQLTHENHNLDEATYNHYPENMRIDNEQLKTVEKMIEIGGNKQKIKADLMKNGNKVIALKTLHNIQTKQRKEKQGSNDVDSMEKLLQQLQQVPNARIRVVTNEDLELIGKYSNFVFASTIICWLVLEMSSYFCNLEVFLHKPKHIFENQNIFNVSTTAAIRIFTTIFIQNYRNIFPRRAHGTNFW